MGREEVLEMVLVASSVVLPRFARFGSRQVAEASLVGLCERFCGSRGSVWHSCFWS